MHRYAVMLVLALVVSSSAIARAQPDIDLDSGSASGSAAGSASGSASGSAALATGSGAGSGSAAPVKDPALAKKLVAAAQQLVARGNSLAKSKPDDAKQAYQNAATAYQSAIDAAGDVNLYLALGQVDEKLTALPDAYKAYQKLVAAIPAGQASLVKQAKARVDDLATKIGIVTLTIVPDDTTVQIDHVEVGVSPLKDPIILMPGTYTLSLNAVAGFQPKDVQLQVDAGSEVSRKLDLDPIPVVITHSAPVTVEAPPPKPKAPPSKLPLLVGAGATGVFAITTVVSGIVAEHDHSVFVAKGSTAQQRFDAKINGQHAADVSDVFLGATVAAAGFTACWYFWKYRAHDDAPPSDDSHNPNAPKLDMVPWVEPGGGGIAAAGAF
jgi:hypothetical protein